MTDVNSIIRTLTARLLAEPARFASYDALIELRVSGAQGGSWVLRMRSPVGVTDGTGGAECTVLISDEDLVAVASGALNPQAAFARGRIRVEGELLQALCLTGLFDATDPIQ